jgi:hypothetical protein
MHCALPLSDCFPPHTRTGRDVPPDPAHESGANQPTPGPPPRRGTGQPVLLPSWEGLGGWGARAKTHAGQEACFKQNEPEPLPADGVCVYRPAGNGDRSADFSPQEGWLARGQRDFPTRVCGTGVPAGSIPSSVPILGSHAKHVLDGRGNSIQRFVYLSVSSVISC